MVDVAARTAIADREAALGEHLTHRQRSAVLGITDDRDRHPITEHAGEKQKASHHTQPVAAKNKSCVIWG